MPRASENDNVYKTWYKTDNKYYEPWNIYTRVNKLRRMQLANVIAIGTKLLVMDLTNLPQDFRLLSKMIRDNLSFRGRKVPNADILTDITILKPWRLFAIIIARDSKLLLSLLFILLCLQASICFNIYTIYTIL